MPVKPKTQELTPEDWAAAAADCPTCRGRKDPAPHTGTASRIFREKNPIPEAPSKAKRGKK